MRQSCFVIATSMPTAPTDLLRAESSAICRRVLSSSRPALSLRALWRHLNHADRRGPTVPHDCIRAGRPSEAPPGALALCHARARGGYLLLTGPSDHQHRRARCGAQSRPSRQRDDFEVVDGRRPGLRVDANGAHDTLCSVESTRHQRIVVALVTDDSPKSAESIAACHRSRKEAAHGLTGSEDVRLARRLRRTRRREQRLGCCRALRRWRALDARDREQRRDAPHRRGDLRERGPVSGRGPQGRSPSR